jgi:hypothetical protein
MIGTLKTTSLRGTTEPLAQSGGYSNASMMAMPRI